jgi:polyhydroxyalkanoate synthase subunit PhaC
LTEQQTGVAPSEEEFENFFDKYNRGLRIVVEGAQADTGRTA